MGSQFLPRGIKMSRRALWENNFSGVRILATTVILVQTVCGTSGRVAF